MKTCGFHFESTYTSLPDDFYTKLKPTPVSAPEIVIINHDLAETIGLAFSGMSSDQQAQLFSGNILPEDTEPFAQAYAGHQFGHFTVLGDGRALTWGEHITPNNQRVDIQFKGSGKTPYSRRGDGRAALGPMLREYIISESMHTLGIPTTRSLAVVTTGENVMRESVLPGAVLTRVASSHIRVGIFEFAAQLNDVSAVESILNYAIRRHYPDLSQADNRAQALIQAVAERQADLIVNWMRVGFIHGVMNSDNMTISGETIDYGPCAFMHDYHPDTVFSSIDHTGRYAYSNQPNCAQWNLARLAECLLPLLDENTNKAIDTAGELIDDFSTKLDQKWLAMMRAKLGLFGEVEHDKTLIHDLLTWMQRNQADFTNTFRDLSQPSQPENRLFQQDSFQNWYQRWQQRLQVHAKPFESSLRLMRKNNPVVIPRNHKVEECLDAAHRGDMNPLLKALEIFKSPYNYDVTVQEYGSPPKPNERVYQTFCGT